MLKQLLPLCPLWTRQRVHNRRQQRIYRSRVKGLLKETTWIQITFFFNVLNPHGNLFLAVRLLLSTSNTHKEGRRRKKKRLQTELHWKGDDSHKKNESWSGWVEWKQLLCKQRNTHKETDVRIDTARTHFYQLKSLPGILPPSSLSYVVSLLLLRNQAFRPWI